MVRFVYALKEIRVGMENLAAAETARLAAIPPAPPDITVNIGVVPAGHFVNEDTARRFSKGEIPFSSTPMIEHASAVEGKTEPAPIEHRDEGPSPKPSLSEQPDPGPRPAAARAEVIESERRDFEVSHQRRPSGAWYAKTHPYD